MTVYDLDSEPLAFVGCEAPGTTGIPIHLKVWELSDQDKPKASNMDFALQNNIVSSGLPSGPVPGQVMDTELKIWGHKIVGPDLANLCNDLKDRGIRVNHDGYCYYKTVTYRTIGTSSIPSTSFIRMNDMFDWGVYLPSGVSRPDPKKHWNRKAINSNTNFPWVDIEQLSKDLEKAKLDLKNCGDEKTRLNTTNTQLQQTVNDLTNRIAGLTTGGNSGGGNAGGSGGGFGLPVDGYIFDVCYRHPIVGRGNDIQGGVQYDMGAYIQPQESISLLDTGSWTPPSRGSISVFIPEGAPFDRDNWRYYLLRTMHWEIYAACYDGSYGYHDGAPIPFNVPNYKNALVRFVSPSGFFDLPGLGRRLCVHLGFKT